MTDDPPCGTRRPATTCAPVLIRVVRRDRGARLYKVCRCSGSARCTHLVSRCPRSTAIRSSRTGSVLGSDRRDRAPPTSSNPTSPIHSSFVPSRRHPERVAQPRRDDFAALEIRLEGVRVVRIAAPVAGSTRMNRPSSDVGSLVVRSPAHGALRPARSWRLRAPTGTGASPQGSSRAAPCRNRSG